MPPLLRLLIGYRISTALGATVIAVSIAALSGAWWALGYFYVLCEATCSLTAALVNHSDGFRAQLAHLALSAVWVLVAFLTVPSLVMMVWPPVE